tara:strand:+ start:56 stop:631 length:576 start_codon:yes stop_codon:yes gene_type:complete
MIISIMIKWFSKINEKVVFSFHFPPYVRKKGISMTQIHGNTILINPKKDKMSGDGILASDTGSYWVKTADCMCVAIVGRGSSGIVHAGWKGLNAGVVSKMASMIYGEKEIFVFPFANVCCYEFGKDLAKEHFIEKELLKQGAKNYLDMKKILQKQIQQNIHFHDECTICNKRFASKRAGRKGFNWVEMKIS